MPTMSIVFSHTTALEILRDPALGPRIAQARTPMALDDTIPDIETIAGALSQIDMALSGENPIEVAYLGASGAHADGARVAHRYSVAPPVGSILRVAEGIGVVSPEFLLFQMAAYATELELTLLVCELCGLYSLSDGAQYGMAQRTAPLTSKEKIGAYLTMCSSRSRINKVRRAVDHACEMSGSPRESMLYLRFSLPRRLGGYDVPVLSMNESVELARLGDLFRARRERKPDLVLSLPDGERPGICVEYAGAPHLGQGRPQLDDLRQNELMAAGFSPYTIWNDQYNSVNYMDDLVDNVIRQKLGLARRRPGEKRLAIERAQRDLLLCELNAIDGHSWGVSNKGPEYLDLLARLDEARAAA